jgi:PEP-CTERM motif
LNAIADAARNPVTISVPYTLKGNVMITRKLSVIFIIPVIGLAVLTCGMARANLVTNGGFEFYGGVAPKDFTSNCLPTDWSTGGYVYLDAPGTAVTAPGIQVWGPFPATSPQGGNFIESDGSSGLAFPINQTITGLTVGQNYSVSFYQAAGQQYLDSGATTEQWQVSLGSDTQFSAVMSTPSEGVFPWEPQTLSYTASSTSEVLTFLAVGSGGVPPIVFLDGVDMETNVPEPSAGLLLAGVGTVIAIGKLWRRVRANRTEVAV